MTGPWVMSAVVCRRAATPDAVQIVEQLELASPVDLALVVHIARGAWRGPIPVRVTGRSPIDEQVARLDLDLALGDEPEATGRVLVPIVLRSLQHGVYWFDIVAGETHMTRVPLPVR